MIESTICTILLPFWFSHPFLLTMIFLPFVLPSRELTGAVGKKDRQHFDVAVSKVFISFVVQRRRFFSSLEGKGSRMRWNLASIANVSLTSTLESCRMAATWAW